MDRNQSTGTLYAFGASIALAGSFVFSKSVLNQLSMVHFGLLWFSMGIVWNGAWFLFRREYRNLGDSPGARTAVALTIAVLEGIATGLFYMSIKSMDNPAVVSFIGNAGPVFVTVLGMTFLKERFRGSQLAGIVITILGVFVINYRQGGFTGLLDPGSLYVIGASLLFSLATILGRMKRKLLNPGYMSLLRTTLLAIAMGVILWTGPGEKVFDLSLQVWRDLLLGSFLETMIVIVFAYQALRLIEATRTSLIISLKGVWTLVLAWIFLGVFPSGVQLGGGIITLAGVWLITWDRPVFRRG
jgi:drug/metabolite transporter (DMT)-like permease